MKIDVSFPETKISETFLAFAEPLLATEDGQPPTPEEVENALKLAFTVWNAVVYDTVHGNNAWVAQLRNQVASHAPLSTLIEQMILRKRTQFDNDLRLVGKYELVESEGDWRLRVEARAPTATP